MLTSLLIANRGEIARRVIRTCRRLGVRTVAVYSQADADAPHVREADEAVPIGPPPAAESYLRGEKIIEAALSTGAEAIHPGYGFLSENAAFAEAVAAAGLIWVGPPPSAIRAMGLKDAAKTLMDEAGVPVTPGYLGDDQSEDRLSREAAATGWPVLIKAVAGGGGKGMRKVERAENFAEALGAARREAKAAFGDDRVLIEKYVTRPRHIEVQVFADRHGNVVHLFERDCSLQRRHQKVIEEAPAPGMDEATRAAVCAAAVKAALAVGYEGAGTVEFIADASDGLRPDRIWFMEMNTRLQVEHPVTEAITGQDLVEWQLRVASGEPLPLGQDDLRIHGWAMEARLYAENPATGFLPSTGPLTHFRLPFRGKGVRVDTGVEQGGEVSTFYDPMIAKLIVHAPTREAAAADLAAACRQVEVWPVKTNAAFLARCLDQPDFVSGDVDTGFIERRLEQLTESSPPSVDALTAAARHLAATEQPAGDPISPWSRATSFRLNAPAQAAMRLEHAGAILDAPLHLSRSREREGPARERSSRSGRVRAGDGARPGEAATPRPPTPFGRGPLLLSPGEGIIVFENGQALQFRLPRAATDAGEAASDGAVLSPMPGKIVAVAAAQGDTVAKGAPLVTLEAMKMEHALKAPFDGTVAELKVKPGDQVSEGALLARLEASV